MKNIFVILFTGLAFMSCGLLFTTNNNASLNTLQLSGGGYLSTDEYNEITPFVFRDTNGIAYLFFSSDRAGTYDIWYSLMNTDGTFENPVRLPSPVNETNSDEMYPVIFYDSSMEMYYLGLIRVSSNITNMQAYDLIGLQFTNIANQNYSDPYSITGLGYFVNGDYSYPMMISNKTSWMYRLGFSDGILIDTRMRLLTSCYSANGFTIPIQNGYSDIFIKTVKTGEKFQLAAEMLSRTTVIQDFTFPSNFSITNTQTISNSIPVEAYLSKFNDMSPFVDTTDKFKVYFASDRYGKGNYDLYRYNIDTFFNLPATKNLLAVDKSAPSVNFGDATNNQVFYYTLPVYANDNFCNPSFLKVYGGSNIHQLTELYYDSRFGYWIVNLPEMGSFMDIYIYAQDWFGNISATNFITIYENGS